MKRFLRRFIIEAVTLYLINDMVAGLVFKNGLLSLLATSLALTAATYVIKPILSLLLLPLTIVTFGLFKWVTHAIMLYLVDLVLDEFQVTGFAFPGLKLGDITIDPVNIENMLFAYILFSFILTIATTLVHWLFK